jgi:uncharacterized protein (DUF362 family)
MKKLSRRDFIQTGTTAAIGAVVLGSETQCSLFGNTGLSGQHAVSIARIKNGNIAFAVEEAVDLLGGIKAVTEGREKIMLKPNLVYPDRACTTKPEVIKALAHIMQKAGKEVMIGEGSASAPGINMIDGEQFRTNKTALLNSMQQQVFDSLGYSDLAQSMNIPLVNLHTGEMVQIPLKDGLFLKSLKVHKSLDDIDLLCSVPMMKTHVLATVTLAMKNLVGLYPGSVYSTVRSWLHTRAADAGSPGVAWEVVEMNRAIKTGFCLIDASSAMEGNGPSDGTLVDMGLIIAGTSPLAVDMVGATIMGFDHRDIPTLEWAHKSGMLPTSLSDIEVRGLPIESVVRKFKRPEVIPWKAINGVWGNKEI